MMASLIDNTATNSVCASCGKEGGNLNMCNKCKMVSYCNAACKKKHRSKHKKACERRVAELHDEELFKEPPPQEECPICLLPLPLNPGQINFESCCGKLICSGCIIAMVRESRGRGKIDLCAFCRAPDAASDEEHIKRTEKLIAAGNSYGFLTLAGYYRMGIRGMPRDYEKANELFLRAGELGCPEAYVKLGYSYSNGEGVEFDKKKATHYYELAAMNGDVIARHNLGYMEYEAGNIARAYKHLKLAAMGGNKESLDNVKAGFMSGHISKDEYEHTLRAHQSRNNEMKSDDRDKAAALYQTQREEGW